MCCNKSGYTTTLFKKPFLKKVESVTRLVLLPVFNMSMNPKKRDTITITFVKEPYHDGNAHSKKNRSKPPLDYNVSYEKSIK